MASGVYAQTCCSGGVPLSTNLGFSTDEVNTLHLAFSTDYNRLNTLYNKSETLAHNNRKRKTDSYLVRAGYDFAHGISIETLLPIIVQRREITQNNGGNDTQRTSGLGDLVILFRKKILKNPIAIDISAGIKLPSGSTSKTNNNGLLLVNDLQPGSGSLDGIFILSTSIPLRGSLDLYSVINYQHKGVDDDYLGSLSYGFGNEFQMTTGLSDQVSLGNQVFSPSIGLRFRQRYRDEIDDSSLENTGGTWLMGQIGLGWLPNPTTNISIQIDIPIYTEVGGTQLSNDYILNFTVYKKFTL